MKNSIEIFFAYWISKRSLTKTFLRELKVLVNQLLGYNLNKDLITLANYLSITRCRQVRVCDEDDDLSLYFLEALVPGRYQWSIDEYFHVFVFIANQNQRLPTLKLHLSLAFDLNQPKFASRMLRADQDLPEEVDLIPQKCIQIYNFLCI